MKAAELEKAILIAPFVDLEPHLRRGAVWLVYETLSLAEVGAALAQDQKAQVEAWLAQQVLRKANATDAQSWRRTKQFFRILIVQPFVLAQDYRALRPDSN